jgi:hypothetical protein
VRGAALEQAVGEAARGGADVEAAPPDRIDARGRERVGELHAPARDVGGRVGHGHRDVVGDEHPRLLRAPALHPQPHLAREHGRGGAGAGREQAAGVEQGVQAHSGHPAER